ncbi:hypothetical protein FHS61_001556 [Altererythrobacter atlanticus]|uniref:DUF8021 domain-containing protein n=1 Tax=Croceibacterium atlanticum TaxID=1267766 RepID=A0A0F7KYB2_9SPHN|nr:hypothetical protein [Croceibacterium atlanticum]AKH44236.1 hypothetical protein WYH_03217 [Croceibacterium atlanticum]MBB5732547.1 hypothetical protein [Croceibacterium atlanticum]
MTLSIRAAVLAAACLFAVPAAVSAEVPLPPKPEQSCQRECLEDYVNRYLAAMRDQDVDDDLFADNVRFTENGIELPIGNEGLWATTSGLGNYTFYVPDVETQQVAFLGTVMETAGSSAAGAMRDPEPVGLALRLRIDDQGRISEVEQIAARPDRPLGDSTGESSSPFPATGEAVEKMGSPHPHFLQAIPEDERMSRADLIAVANQYFEGMQRNDGKGYYPFTDDCVRHENGMLAAAPVEVVANLPERPAFGRIQTCKGQYETGLKGVVTGIRDRRFVAVDQERGIVFAFAFFDHRPINWTWQLGELFKIEKGLMSRIEAIFIRGPYGINSGWSTYEQGRSEEIQDVR